MYVCIFKVMFIKPALFITKQIYTYRDCGLVVEDIVPEVPRRIEGPAPRILPIHRYAHCAHVAEVL